MPEFEVFFDHTCPYCYRSHIQFMDQLEKYPGAKIVWRPVEAHPKVEEPGHRPYEDLAVQGAFFVREHNAGLELAYHERVYKPILKKKRRLTTSKFSPPVHRISV